MATIFTAAQMKKFESAHVAAKKNTWTGLMECAAAAALKALGAHFGDDLPKRVHVLCGPGNNGGDGYAMAALLHDQGRVVQVWQYGERPPSSEAARKMMDRWQARGSVSPLASLTKGGIRAGDLVIDAIFGIGLNRRIDADLHAILMALPASCHRVAVDILSGINADTGEYLGPQGDGHPRPVQLTVTFACMKPGHILGMGAALAGRVLVAPIGLEEELAGARAAGEDPVRLLDAAVLPWQQHLVKSPLHHKYDHGHVLVLAGGSVIAGRGKGGAARLAAGAALRVGAGLVTLGAHRDAVPEHAAHLNAIMLEVISTRHELEVFLADERVNTIVLGPGYGKGAATRAIVLLLLSFGRNLVLDADSLTSFAGNPEELYDQLHPKVVLTPHAGEFRQVFPACLKETGSRLRVIHEAADLSGATVVLKGHDTVIASQGRQICVACPRNRQASAWLATAGSGDVLAGLIGGLLARGAEAHTAACMAVQLHHDAAAIFGPGLTADDLAGALAAAIAARCQAQEPVP